MKKEKKEFVLLREKIKRYNKIIIGILAIFIAYALIHSVLILDCNDAFTELGVAMLSSVLKSTSAIKVNREIMRAFVTCTLPYK